MKRTMVSETKVHRELIREGAGCGCGMKTKKPGLVSLRGSVIDGLAYAMRRTFPEPSFADVVLAESPLTRCVMRPDGSLITGARTPDFWVKVATIAMLCDTVAAEDGFTAPYWVGHIMVAFIAITILALILAMICSRSAPPEPPGWHSRRILIRPVPTAGEGTYIIDAERGTAARHCPGPPKG
jgi:hypothetical protein